MDEDATLTLRQSPLDPGTLPKLLSRESRTIGALCAQVDGVRTALHDLQRGDLLGDEEDRLDTGERLADQLGSGLRLPDPGRSPEDQSTATRPGSGRLRA